MAKYHGTIGFAVTEETKPDVWEEKFIERSYSGELLRDRRYWQDAQKVNSDLRVSHRISIVADIFAISNIHHIRYATWMGTKWEVTSVEREHPRLILELGSVYNDGGDDDGDQP